MTSAKAESVTTKTTWLGAKADGKTVSPKLRRGFGLIRGGFSGAAIGLIIVGCVRLYLSFDVTIAMILSIIGVFGLVGLTVSFFLGWRTGAGEGPIVKPDDDDDADTEIGRPTMSLMDVQNLVSQKRLEKVMKALQVTEVVYPDHMAVRMVKGVTGHVQGDPSALREVSRELDSTSLRPRDLALTFWIVQTIYDSLGIHRGDPRLSSLIRRLRDRAIGLMERVKSDIVERLMHPRMKDRDLRKLIQQASELTQCFNDYSASGEVRAASHALREATERVRDQRNAIRQARFATLLIGVVATTGALLFVTQGFSLLTILAGVLLGAEVAALWTACTEAKDYRRQAWRAIGAYERHQAGAQPRLPQAN